VGAVQANLSTEHYDEADSVGHSATPSIDDIARMLNVPVVRRFEDLNLQGGPIRRTGPPDVVSNYTLFGNLLCRVSLKCDTCY
jgi:hypothetical protein